MPAEVRLGSRQCPQLLQLRTPPRRQINLQAAPLGSTGRVAVAVQLTLTIKDTRPPNRRNVRVSLTEPLSPLLCPLPPPGWAQRLWLSRPTMLQVHTVRRPS